MQFKSVSLVAAAALALCSLGAQAANGFANGGFEKDGAPDTAAANWLAAASGYSRSTDAHSGSFSAQLASPSTNAAVMLQNSEKDGGKGPLMAGDVTSFSFWAKGTAGTTGNVLFALRFLDTVGNIKYDSGNQFFQGSLSETSWTQITFTPAVAVPVGATAAFVEFSQAIGPIGGDLKPGLVLIDDVHLNVTAVPEPGTYALMLAGLAGVGALARRRRAA